MLRSFLKTGALSLFCVAFFLLLLELFLREFRPQRMMDLDHPPMFERDARLGHRLIPNFAARFQTTHLETFIKINSMGLRDTEMDTWTGTRRILVLGDSFTFGHSVNLEDTYVKRLERLFAERKGMKITVINGGVCSYSTRQEVVRLKELEGIIKPDLVILQFFVGNDISENLNTDAGIYRSHPAMADAVYWVKRLLWSRSHLYIFVRNRLVLLYANYNERYQPKEASKFAYTVPAGQTLAAAKQTWREEMSLTETYLEDFTDSCGRGNYRCMVLLVPSPESLAFRIEREEFFREQVKEFLAKRDLIYLDLEPKLKDLYIRHKKIYASDGHWNPEGNQDVAGFVFEYLLAKGMLGTETEQDRSLEVRTGPGGAGFPSLASPGRGGSLHPQ